MTPDDRRSRPTGESDKRRLETRFAGWQGNAFIGGLSSETLLRLILKGDKVDSEERISVQRRIRDVIQAPDGAVLLLSDGKSGELLRLTPASR